MPYYPSHHGRASEAVPMVAGGVLSGMIGNQVGRGDHRRRGPGLGRRPRSRREPVNRPAPRKPTLPATDDRPTGRECYKIRKNPGLPLLFG